MRPKISASKKLVKQIHQKIKLAKDLGNITMLRKAQALLGVVSNLSYEEIAHMTAVSVETIRLWVNGFLLKGINFLKVKASPGRPPKLTKEQIKDLKKAIKNGPESCGYDSGCWRSPLVQDCILKNFGIFYSVAYIAQLLKNLGFSYQKAFFTSAHIDQAKRKEWIETQWPEILKLSKKKNSYLFFGDEASFPQWGSLSYTWSPKGKQPTVKTSGSRKGYKVFGLIDYWTGKFIYKTITGRFNSQSYSDFLLEVIKKLKKHIIVIQDGARYHTSNDMCVFFYEQRKRLTVFQMPAYSPDYNPIEILWKKIKTEGIHLRYFPTFDMLMQKVNDMLAKFADSKDEVLKVFGFYHKDQKA